MYNYHTDTIWTVNAVLLCVVALTSLVILLAAAIKNYLWEKRRRGLLNIKKDVYEFALSRKGASTAACPPFVNNVTPQQFIDIETNRRIDSVFFNDSEQQFLKSCFIKPEDLAKLEEAALRSGNKWRKIEAVLCLGYTQAGSAVDILEKTLLSKDRDVSYFSIISLGHINTVHAARILLDFLKKDPSISSKIVSILENFPGDIADDVLKLSDYHDPLVRYWALTLLSKFTSRGHIRKLEKLTEDMMPEIRAAACVCLGNTGDAEAKPALVRRLKDDSWLVRSRAVHALAKIVGDSALPDVAALINDPSWVVVDAVKAVMTGHIEASMPYIEKFLTGDYEVAKKCSVLALQDSGYMDKILKEAISGKSHAIKLLKDVIRSKFHSGLNAALGSLDPAMREKVLEVIMTTKEA
ncbi:MAG: HEAT repeat domain-containing protein [Candidatus Omnitrophica bacterium]|nr:HEAT repeat domain-containing protein [Candidatus Omnitrophota bacterium]